MKKLIALLISGIIMLPCVNAFANDVIEVYIDGEKLECDVNPKNIDERVLVPMRAIFEAFVQMCRGTITAERFGLKETANLYACLLIIKL